MPTPRGIFDPDLLAVEWFDDKIEGWFDDDLVAVASGGAYTLTAASGAFTLSGQAATLKAGRKLTAASGAYAWTGQAATLKRGYRVTAASGSYALAGQAATLRITRYLAGAGGSFSLTGTVATLKHGYLLTAGSGAYVLNGQAATLTHSGGLTHYSLAAAGGTYSLTGQSASLVRGLRLVANTGSLLLSGGEVDLRYGATAQPEVVTGGGTARPRRPAKVVRRMPVVQGGPVTFRVQRVLRAEPGVVMVPIALAPVARPVVVPEAEVQAAAPVARSATPAPAPVLTHHALAAAPATYALSGNVTSMHHARRLRAGGGEVSLPPEHPFTDDEMLAVLLLLAA